MIWLIIRDTIRGAIRGRRAHFVFLVLLAILILPNLFIDEPKYTSLATYSFFAYIIALYLSSDSIGREIRDKRIDLVITKPIGRFEILYGRLIGYLIVSFTGFALCHFVYLVIVWLRQKEPASSLNIELLFLTVGFIVVINIGLDVLIRRARNWFLFIGLFFIANMLGGVVHIPGINHLLKTTLEVILIILPPFSRLNPFSFQLTPLTHLFYILLYLLLFIILSTIMFNRREIGAR